MAEISRKLTLEEREWDRLLDYQLTIKKVVLARVTSLSSALFPVFVNVISILIASISNPESFAKTKDPMQGAHSVR